MPINSSPRNSLTFLFSKMKTPADLYSHMEKIDLAITEFSAFFNRIETDRNFQPSLSQITKQKEYLSLTFDLMEYGISANYPYCFSYRSFLQPQKKLELSGDTHASLASEFIFSRYTYALGVPRLLKKRIQSHIANCLGPERSYNAEEFKEILEMYKEGFVRLAKVKKGQNILWGLLNPRYLANPELSQATFEIVYKINEINLANMYVYDTVMRIGPKTTENELSFLESIAYATWKKIETSKSFLKNFSFFHEIETLRQFLDSFDLFHRSVLNFLLLKQNKIIEKSIHDEYREGVSISSLYFENHLIASKILELETQIDLARTRSENRLFINFVFDFFMNVIKSQRDLIKMGVKLFEQMKDDVLKNLREKPTLEQIYQRIPTDDWIAKKVEQLCSQ